MNIQTRGMSLIAGRRGIAALMLAVLVQPAAAEFSAPDIEVDEGEVAVFKITLPSTYDFALRYKYNTKDGSAKAGTNYDAKSGTLLFSAGTQSLEVEVKTYLRYDAVTRDFTLELTEREMSWNDGWSGAWAVIYAPGVPKAKTIRATINDIYIGETGPE
ncbi:MAG: hypothetical protein OXH88_02930 [Gammaproteobacteria bacterium]|nr:hypothetical protein [Gammaproteobacteria bacterium]